MNCRICNAEIVEFTKYIGHGPKMGNVYHYKAHCPNEHSYHVERTQEVYKVVKDQPWNYSKSYRKYEEEKHLQSLLEE